MQKKRTTRIKRTREGGMKTFPSILGRFSGGASPAQRVESGEEERRGAEGRRGGEERGGEKRRQGEEKRRGEKRGEEKRGGKRREQLWGEQ